MTWVLPAMGSFQELSKCGEDLLLTPKRRHVVVQELSVKTAVDCRGWDDVLAARRGSVREPPLLMAAASCCHKLRRLAVSTRHGCMDVPAAMSSLTALSLLLLEV